jgi:hypothetical protein
MYHQLIGKTVFFTRLAVRSMELANLDLLRNPSDTRYIGYIASLVRNARTSQQTNLNISADCKHWAVRMVYNIVCNTS